MRLATRADLFHWLTRYEGAVQAAMFHEKWLTRALGGYGARFSYRPGFVFGLFSGLAIAVLLWLHYWSHYAW